MGQENANSLEDVLLFHLHPRGRKVTALWASGYGGPAGTAGTKLSWPEPPHSAPLAC